ncbi:MAG: hypothetical protein PHG05_00400 [Candidatus Nanoarchaeia archaeon]|nr:hypothetical protein [Candidatus Nanoarchaeia archaeon]
MSKKSSFWECANVSLLVVIFVATIFFIFFELMSKASKAGEQRIKEYKLLTQILSENGSKLVSPPFEEHYGLAVLMLEDANKYEVDYYETKNALSAKRAINSYCQFYWLYPEGEGAFLVLAKSLELSCKIGEFDNAARILLVIKDRDSNTLGVNHSHWIRSMEESIHLN